MATIMRRKCAQQLHHQVLKSLGAKGNFGHSCSLEQHADGTNQLARYDFLLVFDSNFTSRQNHCRVESHGQQTTVPNNKNDFVKYPMSRRHNALSYDHL